MRALCAAACLALCFSTNAFADDAAVRVLSSSELSTERQRRLAVAAEVALKELSGFSVKEAGKAAIAPLPRGARKGCAAELACALEVAKEAGVRHVLVISGRTDDGQLVVDGHLVDVEDKRGARKVVEEGNPSEPEAAAKLLVERVVPPWARKGWGGISVASDASLVKVDGQLLNDEGVKEPLPLPAGKHDVDVLLGDGRAVLQRLEVPEGGRAVVSEAALPRAELGRSGSSAASTLRYAGYGTWTAGVLFVAGSFIAGALANQTMATVRVCEGSDRSCTTNAEAQSTRQRAESYATTGNVLLGAGLGLSAVGAGLVTFDLVQ